MESATNPINSLSEIFEIKTAAIQKITNTMIGNNKNGIAQLV